MPELSPSETMARLERLIRSRSKHDPLVALIVDSPWLPGFAGVDTLDFYFDSRTWLEAYEAAHRELPGAALVPGAWVELGMAAEPSGFGVGICWSHEAPPQMRPRERALEFLPEADPPDPERDGLMPVILRQYERLTPELARRGFPPRIAAARGPLAVAAHVAGLTEFLTAIKLWPEKSLTLVEKTTELCIRWLASQLQRMTDPLAILVLDDVVGLMSPQDAARFAFPPLERIFGSFPRLLHFFHDDSPNPAVFPGLAGVGIDVFNFTHEVAIEEARELLGPDVVLMGNLAPLDLLVRGTAEEVRRSTEQLLAKAERYGPLLISAGGGVSPGTPVANLKAMLEVVQA
ncbi:MAG: uroporphyrinogen decarboxylase family protein [Planctomycetota bacterium]